MVIVGTIQWTPHTDRNKYHSCTVSHSKISTSTSTIIRQDRYATFTRYFHTCRARKPHPKNTISLTNNYIEKSRHFYKIVLLNNHLFVHIQFFILPALFWTLQCNWSLLDILVTPSQMFRKSFWLTITLYLTQSYYYQTEICVYLWWSNTIYSILVQCFVFFHKYTCPVFIYSYSK